MKVMLAVLLIALLVFVFVKIQPFLRKRAELKQNIQNAHRLQLSLEIITQILQPLKSQQLFIFEVPNNKHFILLDVSTNKTKDFLCKIFPDKSVILINKETKTEVKLCDLQHESILASLQQIGVNS